MAISGRQLRFRRGFPIIQPCTARFPRRFAPRNDTSGWPGGGNCALHRIRSTFAASRTGAACRSPTMARAVGDTARKFTTAHGARYPQGARRIRKAESRQRLRSERRYIFLSRSRRRYRRNRSVRFYRHLERTGSAFPRLPRRFAPRNDKSGAILILTVTCTNRQQCAGRGTPRLRDFHSIIIISRRPASAFGSPCPDSSAAGFHQSACPPAPWPPRRTGSGRRGGRSRAL